MEAKDSDYIRIGKVFLNPVGYNGLRSRVEMKSINEAKRRSRILQSEGAVVRVRPHRKVRVGRHAA